MSNQQNEDNAFTIKYDQYSNMIYRLSLTYLSNYSDCEDILQEVFIKLLKQSPKFKSQEHEKRWLLRITVNACIDKIRNINRYRTMPLEEDILLLRLLKSRILFNWF